MDPHYFAFRPHPGVGPRPCGDCGLPYDLGNHIEITTLKAFTNYVCPTGGGYGHSSIYTGALRPDMRTLRQHLCICGAEFVEEDAERWLVSFEVDQGTGWHPVEVVRSKHAAQQQHEGLLAQVQQGEPIRNVRLAKLEGVRR